MGMWIRLGWALVALAAFTVAISGTGAQAAVYWGSSTDGLGAANLDGSNPLWDYLYWPYMAETDGPACGVAVNSEYLYWDSPRGIGRRKLEGEGFYPGTVVPGLEGPCGIALDQSHVYWGNAGHPLTSPRSGSIGRADLDGSEATGTFITGLERPCDVAVAGGHLFWIEQSRPGEPGGVGRANLDGSLPQRPLIDFPGFNPSCGLASGPAFIYWGQGDAIARANLEGGEVDDAFIPGTGTVQGIAVQGGRIYWSASWPAGTSSIGRANLDGTEANPHWLPSTERELLGVAVDERPTPPFLRLPSRPLRFFPNLQYNLRAGAVLLGVYVPPHGRPAAPTPPQGRLAVVSPGISWTVFGSTVRLPGQGNSYLFQVRLRPGSGPVGRRIRRELARRGWAPVKVRLTYEEERVYPVEATRKLILRRYRGATAGWVKHPGPPPNPHPR